MKTCPTCKETYDDDINFCLADGSTLLKKRGGKGAKHSHWNDVIALLLGAVALLVFLCLVTGSSDDRSWLPASSTTAPIKNWIGPLGATIAAVLFNAIGWTAYFVPLLVALIALRVYQSSTLVPRVSRVLGYLFFAISLSGLFAILGGYGAIVGEAIGQGLAHFISKIGAAIVLFAVFASSVLLITNFTLEGFLSHFNVAWENLRIRFDEWRDKRREADSGSLGAAKARAEKRKQMRGGDSGIIPPTISVGEMEALAAAAEKNAHFDEEPSIPTITPSPKPSPIPSELIPSG